MRADDANAEAKGVHIAALHEGAPSLIRQATLQRIGKHDTNHKAIYKLITSIPIQRCCARGEPRNHAASPLYAGVIKVPRVHKQVPHARDISTK